MFVTPTLIYIRISTHSLTRRLTGSSFGFICLEDISTHSLTRRLTSATFLEVRCCNISTHSLTRRLTTYFITRLIMFHYFNSQPHKEADGRAVTSRVIEILFQLTASQGG